MTAPSVPRVATSLDDLRIGQWVVSRASDTGWSTTPYTLRPDDMHPGLWNFDLLVVVILSDPPQDPIETLRQTLHALEAAGGNCSIGGLVGDVIAAARKVANP